MSAAECAGEASSPEQTNERSEVREQSEQCGTSNKVSGASERVDGEANGPVLFVTIS